MKRLGQGILLAFSLVHLNADGANGQFPEFESDRYVRSAMFTWGGPRYWDRRFAATVNDALVVNDFREIAFCFNQCFGGGMIDDLQLTTTNASYSSAARFDQIAWARSEDAGNDLDLLFPQFRRTESLYNRRDITKCCVVEPERKAAYPLG